MVKEKESKPDLVPLLGIESLRGNLDLSRLDGFSGFAVGEREYASNSFDVEHPDGRKITVSREAYAGKIVLEVAERLKYDRKVQGKLRRSFIEPKEDLLGKEIGRQIVLLLRAYSPIYAAREDQKEKAGQEHARRHAEAMGYAGILRAKRSGVTVEDPDSEKTSPYHAAKVKAFLAKGDGTGTVWFQVVEGGVEVEFREPVSPAVAATLAEALAPYVAPRIACKGKNGREACDRDNLADADERRDGLCDFHRPEEGQ